MNPTKIREAIANADYWVALNHLRFLGVNIDAEVDELQRMEKFEWNNRPFVQNTIKDEWHKMNSDFTERLFTLVKQLEK